MRAPARRAIVLSCALTFATSHAWAQDAVDAAASTVLFDEARELSQAGKWKEACIKFEESERLASTVNTRYWLADCYEHEGRFATAWAMFGAVISQAKAKGESAKEQKAKERSDALVPRLTKLVVRVTTPDLAGIVVKRNGATVGKGQWGSALPTDPGKYAFEASAPGMKPWKEERAIEGEGKTIEVVIPALEALPAEVAPPPPTTAPPTSAPTPTPTTPVTSDDGARGGTQRVIGLVVAGAGVVATGIGVVTWLSGKSSYDDAIGRCTLGATRDRCSSADDSASESAIGKWQTGKLVAGIGAVMMVGGAVLYFAAPSGSAKTTAATAPRVGFGLGSVVVSGAF